MLTIEKNSTNRRNYGTFTRDDGCGVAGSCQWGNVYAMNPEEYRRKGQHYLMLSRQMTDVTNRAAMIDLAAIWMRLARQAELNEHLVKQLEQAQRA
jgi:hypothetical protein